MIKQLARTIFYATRELPEPDPTCITYEYNEAWVMYRNRETYIAQSVQTGTACVAAQPQPPTPPTPAAPRNPLLNPMRRLLSRASGSLN